MKRLLSTLAFALALSAQTPPSSPTNHVLCILTVKPTIAREQIMKTLPDEVKATVRLYLAGKIEQWYARADGKGVVFVLNAASTDEAQALMDGLPLGKEKLADFQFMPLSPLTPLRTLLGTP